MRGTTAVGAAALLFTIALLAAGSAAAAPPEVTIENPDDGATVAGNVTINGTADDPDTYGSVTDVEVRIENGTWMAANDTSGPLSDYDTWDLEWNSTWVDDGNHTITARATDSTGETSNTSINVTVANAGDGTDGNATDGQDGNEASPADVNITIEARQSGCPGGRTFCLEVTEGNLTELDPGLRVNATFVNPSGNFPHSLYFADHEDAEPNHTDTPSEAAFARIETTNGGESGNTTFTVPSGADGIYVWCDEPQHESQGMYLHEPGVGHGNGTDGNGTDGGGDDGGTDTGDDDGLGIPGFGAATAAAAAGAAALARRRR